MHKFLSKFSFCNPSRNLPQPSATGFAKAESGHVTDEEDNQIADLRRAISTSASDNGADIRQKLSLSDASLVLTKETARELLDLSTQYHGTTALGQRIFRAIVQKTQRDNPDLLRTEWLSEEEQNRLPNDTLNGMSTDTLCLVHQHLGASEGSRLRAASKTIRTNMLTNVKTLKLQPAILNASADELKTFFAKRPAVTTVDLSQLFNATPAQLQTILDALPEPGKIQEIYLHDLRLADGQNTIVNLGKFNALQVLDVSWPQDMDAASMAVLMSRLHPDASEKTLHTLNMSLTPLSQVTILDRCRVLKRLDVSRARQMNAESMAALMNRLHANASATTLHTLNMSSTPLSEVTILDQCRVLQHLDVSSALDMDAASMAALMNHLHANASAETLHTLNMRGTPQSEVTLLKQCKVLQRLDGYSVSMCRGHSTWIPIAWPC